MSYSGSLTSKTPSTHFTPDLYRPGEGQGTGAAPAANCSQNGQGPRQGAGGRSGKRGNYTGPLRLWERVLTATGEFPLPDWDRVLPVAMASTSIITWYILTVVIRTVPTTILIV